MHVYQQFAFYLSFSQLQSTALTVDPLLNQNDL